MDAGQAGLPDGGRIAVLHPALLSPEHASVGGAPRMAVDGGGNSTTAPSPSTRCFPTVPNRCNGGQCEPSPGWLRNCKLILKGDVAHIRARMRSHDFDDFLARCHVDVAESLVGAGVWSASKASMLESRVDEEARAGSAEAVETLKGEQRKLRELSEQQLREGSDYFLRALELPQLDERDRVLMKLAIAYATADRNPEAMGSLQQLIDQHPDSAYLPGAYLMLGELHFVEGRWSIAQEFYDKVLALPSSSATACAVYKKAWAVYKRGYPYLARRVFIDCVELLPRKRPEAVFAEACLRDARSLGFSLKWLGAELIPR